MNFYNISFVILSLLGFCSASLAQNNNKDLIDQAERRKQSHPPALKLPPRKLPKDVSQYLQDVSVTIHANRNQGSGVIKTRDSVNYIWTAAHVVKSLRTEREVIDPRTGTKKTVIEFDDVRVVKELVEDGRSVGKLEMLAEVIRYSNADYGEDLALLRVRKKNFFQVSTEFYLDTKIPKIGEKLLHCGSLLGQMGSNSMTTGIMSQHGRVHNNKVYDQTTCAAFPGSSGGGVFTESGLYVGMLVRGSGETFNLIVPQRRLMKWAKKVGIEFTVDDNISVPSDEDLNKYPVEDEAPINFLSKKSTKFKFMIFENATNMFYTRD